MNEQEIWDHYNGLILSTDVDRVRKLLIRYDLFKLSLEVPGDIVECGIFRGVGLMYWLKLLRIYAPASNKRVIGFDSFSPFAGSLLPCEEKSIRKYLQEASFPKGKPEDLLALAQAAGFTTQVEIVVGNLEQTAKEYVDRNPGFRISLLHLDSDTYGSTKASLEQFYPLVSRGGVVIFDEYGDRGWGETDAVDEYFAREKIQVLSVPYSNKPTGYLTKP